MGAADGQTHTHRQQARQKGRELLYPRLVSQRHPAEALASGEWECSFSWMSGSPLPGADRVTDSHCPERWESALLWWEEPPGLAGGSGIVTHSWATRCIIVVGSARSPVRSATG